MTVLFQIPSWARLTLIPRGLRTGLALRGCPSIPHSSTSIPSSAGYVVLNQVGLRLLSFINETSVISSNMPGILEPLYFFFNSLASILYSFGLYCNLTYLLWLSISPALLSPFRSRRTFVHCPGFVDLWSVFLVIICTPIRPHSHSHQSPLGCSAGQNCCYVGIGLTTLSIYLYPDHILKWTGTRLASTYMSNSH